MKIKVTGLKKETVNVKEGSTVSDVLKKIDVDVQNVLVTRNKTLIVGTTKLNDKDTVELLSVISGG
ncbi:thiamine biosynthesis protein ThiS [archaeon]|nr:thiamine biosynthesis protein ThiS [archaeon]